MSMDESKGNASRFNELEKEFVFHSIDKNVEISIHDLPIFVRLGRSALDTFMILDPVIDLQENERNNGESYIESDIEALIINTGTFDVAQHRGYKAIRRDAPVILGRHDAPDMKRFEAPSNDVSREHAAIRISNDGHSIVIEDLGSTNGTLIGRKATNEIEKQGDHSEKLFKSVNKYSVASSAHPHQNQDATAVHEEAGIFAVFDGMSNFADGLLSTRALKILLNKYAPQIGSSDSLDEIAESLAAFLRGANDTLLKLFDEPGTTAVLAKLNTIEGQKYLSVAHAGDSRAYVLSNGVLLPKTIDHSGYRWLHGDEAAAYQQESYDYIDTKKNLTKDELFDFEQRRFLGNYLGLEQLSLDVNHFPVQPGDVVVLTSDGVHDNLTIREMEAILRFGRPREAAKQLVEYAQKRSKEDHFRSKPDDMTAIAITI